MSAPLHRKESVSPSFPRFTLSPSCPGIARAVVSSYVLRINSLSIDTKNIRRNYEETTARTRPGQEEDLETEAADEENPERGSGKSRVKISD